MGQESPDWAVLHKGKTGYLKCVIDKYTVVLVLIIPVPGWRVWEDSDSQEMKP